MPQPTYETLACADWPWVSTARLRFHLHSMAIASGVPVLLLLKKGGFGRR